MISPEDFAEAKEAADHLVASSVGKDSAALVCPVDAYPSSTISRMPSSLVNSLRSGAKEIDMRAGAKAGQAYHTIRLAACSTETI